MESLHSIFQKARYKKHNTDDGEMEMFCWILAAPALPLSLSHALSCNFANGLGRGWGLDWSTLTNIATISLREYIRA